MSLCLMGKPETGLEILEAIAQTELNSEDQLKKYEGRVFPVTVSDVFGCVVRSIGI